jgi:hypothetical protein
VSAADAVTRCCPLGPHTAEQRAGEPDLCASQSFATRPFMEAFLVLVVLGENGFGVVRLGSAKSAAGARTAASLPLGSDGGFPHGLPGGSIGSRRTCKGWVTEAWGAAT